MRLLAALALSLAAALAAEPVHTLPFDAYRGQVWFPGEVNGEGPLWLLFDSAAGASTISREATQRFGLEKRQFATATVGGAGPNRPTVPVLRGVTLSTGSLHWTPAQLPSVPHEVVDAIFGRRIDAILGKDLLLRYVMEVDSSERKVRLYEPAGYEYRGKGAILPIELADGPIIQATVRVPPGRKLPCRLLVDSAAAFGLMFTTPFTKREGLIEAVRSLSERLVPEMGGGVGGAEGSLSGRIESLELGPFAVSRPVARFADARGGSLARTDFDALAGMAVLSRFRVVFDYSRKRIILEPNASLAEPMEADMSGLTLRSAGASLEEIVIADVHADTPAFAAGLRPGDRVAAVDGRKPASLWEVQRALRAGPGRVVRLGIERDGARREVRLTLRRFV